MSHYASLVVAEKPLEAHQSYRRRRSSVVSGQLPPDLEMGGQVPLAACQREMGIPRTPIDHHALHKLTKTYAHTDILVRKESCMQCEGMMLRACERVDVM